MMAVIASTYASDLTYTERRMYHKALLSLLVILLSLTLAATLARAQVMQSELPLEPGKQVAALTQLKTIFTGMGGEIQMDTPQAGNVSAMFPGGHLVIASVAKYDQGKMRLILTCMGENHTQAQERCTTVQRQYNP
jgi:hypothetical protein